MRVFFSISLLLHFALCSVMIGVCGKVFLSLSSRSVFFCTLAIAVGVWCAGISLMRLQFFLYAAFVGELL